MSRAVIMDSNIRGPLLGRRRMELIYCSYWELTRNFIIAYSMCQIHLYYRFDYFYSY